MCLLMQVQASRQAREDASKTVGDTRGSKRDTLRTRRDTCIILVVPRQNRIQSLIQIGDFIFQFKPFYK